MNSLRIFVIGGLTSYRALFNWLNPWILVPSLMVAPVFQILLFAYLGRNAGIESDEFFVIGNAVQYASVPCVFAMTNTIAGERFQQTLGIILATPAPRIALFLGRSLPVIFNGWLVALFGLVAGGLLLGIHVPPSAWPPIAGVVAIASASCTGLGLVSAAIALHVRASQSAVISNMMFGLLLIFCGANVPLAELPDWMAGVGSVLPLTHAIQATRELADGAALGSVAGQVGLELTIGAAYVAIGLSLLALAEVSSRRRASVEIA